MYSSVTSTKELISIDLSASKITTIKAREQARYAHTPGVEIKADNCNFLLKILPFNPILKANFKGKPKY